MAASSVLHPWSVGADAPLFDPDPRPRRPATSAWQMRPYAMEPTEITTRPAEPHPEGLPTPPTPPTPPSAPPTPADDYVDDVKTEEEVLERYVPTGTDAPASFQVAGAPRKVRAHIRIFNNAHQYRRDLDGEPTMASLVPATTASTGPLLTERSLTDTSSAEVAFVAAPSAELVSIQTPQAGTSTSTSAELELIQAPSAESALIVAPSVGTSASTSTQLALVEAPSVETSTSMELALMEAPSAEAPSAEAPTSSPGAIAGAQSKSNFVLAVMDEVDQEAPWFQELLGEVIAAADEMSKKAD